jgi:hypothetical protein
MIPCHLCGAHDAHGNLRRGLKRRGKTKTNGTKFERFYVCQDCGTLWQTTGDSATRQVDDLPVYKFVKGGSA